MAVLELDDHKIGTNATNLLGSVRPLNPLKQIRSSLLSGNTLCCKLMGPWLDPCQWIQDKKIDLYSVQEKTLAELKVY